MVVWVTSGMDGETKKMGDGTIKSSFSVGIKAGLEVFLHFRGGTEVDKVINVEANVERWVVGENVATVDAM